MSTKFFNNQGQTLFSKFSDISKQMVNFEVFHAVVGYFRSSGYFKLRKEMDNVQEIRILVGINIDGIFSRHNPNLLFNAYSHKEEVLQQFQEDFVNDVKKANYDAETEQGILQFYDDIKTGKLLMRIASDKNLHAKFYLCLPKKYGTSSDGWVIMGSSNLTEYGLGLTQTPRYELNVALKDYDDVAFCEDEFQKLWDEAIPITAEDIDLGPTHFADKQPTPYEVYMKLLIDSFGSIVEDVYNFDPTHYGLMDIAYQRDAVVQGYQIMMQHNGCFIADVVGLGKTVVAALIAQRFIAENGPYSKVLIIFPPSLKDEWMGMFNKLEITRNTDFLSNGSINKIINGEGGYSKPGEYDLIIIDEVHNFRNSGTQRYEDLQKICKEPRLRRGNIDGTRKKVLLLSATPLNNKPDDIKHLLMLFEDENNSTIAGCRNLKQHFNDWHRRFQETMSQRGLLQNDIIIKNIDGIYDEIRRSILSTVMVRRTRHNIMHEKRYAADLKKQNIIFPKVEPLTTCRYEMDERLADLFGRTIDILTDTPDPIDNPNGKGIHYARYRAVEFFNDDVPYKGIQPRQIARLLTGIFRTHMVKRLESSFFAFKKSLQKFRTITDGMIKMFEQDKVLVAPEYKVKEMQADGMDLDDIIEAIEAKGGNRDDFVYHASDFRAELLEMLKDDYDKLDELCKEWESVDVDPKFDVFLNLLRKELFDQTKNPTGKLVVFTESVDTKNYLVDRIKTELHRSDVLSVDAQSRDGQRAAIRKNFDANYKDGPQENKYNIIVTSDVLAEGVNLHRANIIVNYDSPWNTSRLMQRNGRVNRIGSKAPSIFNYMFYPSRQGNAEIQLYTNALIKLQGFHSALGEDSQIYSHEEIVKEFHLYNADVHDETDSLLELQQEVRKLYDNNRKKYDYIKNLPDKSRIARYPIGKVNDSDVPCSVVFLKSPMKKEYYSIDKNGETKEIDLIDAAAIMRAKPEDKAAPIKAALATNYKHVGIALNISKEQMLLVANNATIADDVTAAASFLRKNVKPILKSNVQRMICDNLEQVLKAGIYSNLPGEIKKLANKHKKGLLSDEELVKQIISLAETYGNESIQTDADINYQDSMIILSETFINK